MKLRPLLIVTMLLAGTAIAVPHHSLAATGVAEQAEQKAEKAADRAEKAADQAERSAEKAADKIDQRTDTVLDKDRDTTTKSGDTKTPVKDSWVTAKTKIALFSDGRVKGRQISVETKKGTVVLRGKVDSAEAKSAAGEIAKGVDGVKGVKNNLQVVAPSKRAVVEEKDDNITKNVKSRLKKEPKLRSADIDVRTDAGVVTLKGEVPELLSSAQASWVAWQVRGVKSVKNELTTKRNV